MYIAQKDLSCICDSQSLSHLFLVCITKKKGEKNATCFLRFLILTKCAGVSFFCCIFVFFPQFFLNPVEMLST